MNLPRPPFTFRDGPKAPWLSTAYPDLLGELTAEEIAALAIVPGNTAKAHGRRFATWLFFRFDQQLDPEDRRKRVIRFMGGCAHRGWHTSLQQQLEDRREYRQVSHREFNGQPLPETHVAATKPFMTVLLTGRTFRHLDPTLSRFRTFLAHDSTFVDGQYAVRHLLGDPSGDDDPWDGYGYEQPFDLGLLVARNTREGCNKLVAEVCNLANSCGFATAQREDAFDWRPRAGVGPVEPFGFADGLSNLLFFADDVIEAGEESVAAWNPTGDWRQLLYFAGRDDTSEAARLSGGTFIVLRKLEQDVRAFRAWAHRDPDRASGMMGRTPDGLPLVRRAGPGINGFNFDDDTGGQGCPFHAHIRKANPRGESVGRGTACLAEERHRLFVRRGMMYSACDDYSLEADPPAKTGLLFVGYMASCRDQFQMMMAGWLHNPNFPSGRAPAQDALMPSGPMRTDIPRFVTPRGGAYFFAPPVPWLNSFREYA